MRKRFNATTAQGLAFLVLALTGGYAISHNNKIDAQQNYNGQIAACHRGNKVRGYLRYGAAHVQTMGEESELIVTRAANLFPIINCKATADASGVEVPLSPKAQERYIIRLIQEADNG